MDDAREQVLFGLAHCDILKISDNEIQWLTGETDFDRAVQWIQSRLSIPLILLTLGPNGSRAKAASSERDWQFFLWLCINGVQFFGM